jgi:uncharacterized hydrophobic protein (TIGR00271 family)
MVGGTSGGSPGSVSRAEGRTDLQQPNDSNALGAGLTHSALYRWWQARLVRNVDHQRVIDTITDESGLTPRYVFMIIMSAGIAVLGLLLSSPAVVIGAMLISPLMSPILGLGFSLALFDFAELRRSLIALAVGAAAGVLFTALVVLASPLKAPTAEILARTKPNLFDLLVALFAALAGTFAIIRGRGETITGVAIATALMPPLAVVGYGLATWNLPVLAGSFALFITNFVTIALSATIMARLYGFGRRLSAQQSWLQTILLLVAFVAMAVPLGFSLAHIARDAVTVSQIRSFLTTSYGDRARVTQLDVDFDARPIVVRAVVIAPRTQLADPAKLRGALAKRLDRPINLQIDQVLLDPGSSALETQRAELAKAQQSAQSEEQGRATATLVAMAAGVTPDAVTLDRDHQRAVARAVPLPGSDISTYWAIEQRAHAASKGWDVAIVPPLMPLPAIAFADGEDMLDPAARQAVIVSAWAAQRWNVAALAVPGLPAGASEHPSLAARRAMAVRDLLQKQGIAARPAPPAGQSFHLSLAATP